MEDQREIKDTTEIEDMTEDMMTKDMTEVEAETIKINHSMEDINPGKEESGWIGQYTDSCSRIRIVSNRWTVKPRKLKSQTGRHRNTRR
jgi:hypothetical protein